MEAGKRIANLEIPVMWRDSPGESYRTRILCEAFGGYWWKDTGLLVSHKALTDAAVVVRAQTGAMSPEAVQIALRRKMICTVAVVDRFVPAFAA
jgi:hypothetical protein